MEILKGLKHIILLLITLVIVVAGEVTGISPRASEADFSAGQKEAVLQASESPEESSLDYLITTNKTTVPASPLCWGGEKTYDSKSALRGGAVYTDRYNRYIPEMLRKISPTASHTLWHARDYYIFRLERILI